MDISIWNPDTTRSQQALPADTVVLVLDTMGELRDFYATASVAHVGVDHNAREPLGFGKPMTVSPGWGRTYPSFPVFEMLGQPDELMEADDAAALEAARTHCLAQGPLCTALDARARETLAKARGAPELHLQALAPLLGALPGQRPGRS